MKSESTKDAPGPAPTPLRILHLENNASDRELVRLALVHEDIACEFVYASSQAEFAAALDRGKFNLILSDFMLPGYDGASALALAQEKCPEVPYLFVSGAIGEERAIDSLKSGAIDYVLKARLDRLLPAVRRALRDTGERVKRRVAEVALRQSEERFREMAERIEDVFYIAALDTGGWLYVSPAYEQIWGRPLADLYVKPAQWTGAIVPEDRATVLAAREQLAHGREYRIEYRIQRPDGALRWIEDRSYPISDPAGPRKRAVGVAMDITQRRQLEAQLRQAQKMEAVGQLAGGLAHDFNNVLTVINGYARLLLDGGTLPPNAILPLTQIFTAGNRAANLTRQLLVFSRKQTVNRRIVDLNQVASEISALLRPLIGEPIKLQLTLSPDPCPAEADAGMIEQVLMNLAVNARDAMPEGGTLAIATEHVTIDEAAPGRHSEARPGEFIGLSVRDTGCGIPPENLPRIFEPFFTTKAAGHGTGLGLAMVFGIVQQHQGWIEVESTVGVGTCASQFSDMGGTPMPRGTGVPPVGCEATAMRPAGTCFRIMLPAALPATALPADRPIKAAVAGGSAETILLVEDEPAVREFAVTVLQSHGYRVMQAGSGIEALEIWKSHQSRIALLVTDLVLPDGLGGVELAARLRREKPALKAILTSGYANDTAGAEFRPPAGALFIHKPYQPRVLAQAVRDALDNNGNHGCARPHATNLAILDATSPRETVGERST
jgi:two-component system cell cycle sensor histidine kinase/response regulator CckA